MRGELRYELVCDIGLRRNRSCERIEQVAKVKQKRTIWAPHTKGVASIGPAVLAEPSQLIGKITVLPLSDRNE